MKKVQTPVNISPLMRVFFAATIDINQKLSEGGVTVDEAIDIAAAIAKATAREMGVSDKPLAVTDETK